jgi:hypothetical protein
MRRAGGVRGLYLPTKKLCEAVRGARAVVGCCPKQKTHPEKSLAIRDAPAGGLQRGLQRAQLESSGSHPPQAVCGAQPPGGFSGFVARGRHGARRCQHLPSDLPAPTPARRPSDFGKPPAAIKRANLAPVTGRGSPRTAHAAQVIRPSRTTAAANQPLITCTQARRGTQVRQPRQPDSFSGQPRPGP